MAKVKTGIGASKRDLLKKIGTLTKFVAQEKGRVFAERRGCLQAGSCQYGHGVQVAQQDPMRTNLK